MARILMVAAEPMEFADIVHRAAGVEKPKLGVNWARTGRIGSNDFLLVANGATRGRAGAALDAGCQSFRPEAVVSTGFCGAVAPELRIADIVVATEVAWDGRRFPALPVTGARAYRGVVRTLDHVAAAAEERAALRSAGAAAVEMEAAEGAERSQRAGLPFYCIKAVTDLADETLANDFNRALRSDGHFDTIVLLSGALRHPATRLPELFRLRQRCVQAARSLGDFFADCRF